MFIVEGCDSLVCFLLNLLDGGFDWVVNWYPAIGTFMVVGYFGLLVWVIRNKKFNINKG